MSIKRNYICESVNQSFLEVGENLIKNAEYISKPRDLETKEILNVSILVTNPFNRLVINKYRNLSLYYLVGEFLWYERGSNLLNEIKHYSKMWIKSSNDNITLNSSYGNIIYNNLNNNQNINQWEYVKQELINDKFSRRAIMLICSTRFLSLSTKDLPCTISLQFFIRENKLHLISNMRSNDLFMGFCYDAVIFTLWQEKMLFELKKYYSNLEIGYYYHNANSMHIYSRHYEIMQKVLDNKNDNFNSGLYNIPKIDDINELNKLQVLESKIRNGFYVEKDDLLYKSKFANWIKNVLINGKNK